VPSDLFQAVGVAHDLEIEAPVVVDARLPQIAAFIVLLGAEGRMLKIAGKKSKLLPKGLSNSGRSVFRAPGQ
jgi:hypothetical protein